jgi:hypothetical protein
VGIEKFSFVEAAKADRSFKANVGAEADADPICEPIDEESEGAAAGARCGPSFKQFRLQNLLQMSDMLGRHAPGRRAGE